VRNVWTGVGVLLLLVGCRAEERDNQALGTERMRQGSAAAGQAPQDYLIFPAPGDATGQTSREGVPPPQGATEQSIEGPEADPRVGPATPDGGMRGPEVEPRPEPVPDRTPPNIEPGSVNDDNSQPR
jgi:hypothetical protein